MKEYEFFNRKSVNVLNNILNVKGAWTSPPNEKQILKVGNFKISLNEWPGKEPPDEVLCFVNVYVDEYGNALNFGFCKKGIWQAADSLSFPMDGSSERHEAKRVKLWAPVQSVIDAMNLTHAPQKA